MTTSRFLYHPIGNTTTTESPFVSAIHDIAADGVDLTGPYLAPDLLRMWVATTPHWRVVADVREWLLSQGPRAQESAAFIRENVAHIRDCRNLHAKVIIGKSSAMIGSANFTHSGFEHLHEMSAVISAPNEIETLRQWFNALWSECRSPVLDSVDRFAEAVASQQRQLAIVNADRSLLSVDLGPAGPPVHVSTKRPIPLPTRAPRSAPNSPPFSAVNKDNGISRSVRYVFNIGSIFSETAARHALDLLRDAILILGDDPDDHRLYINAHSTALSLEFGNDSILTFRKGSASILVPKSSLDDPSHATWMASKITEKSARTVLITLPWMSPFQLPTAVRSAWMTCINEKAARSGPSTTRQSLSDDSLSDQIDWRNTIVIDERRDSLLRFILGTRSAQRR